MVSVVTKQQLLHLSCSYPEVAQPKINYLGVVLLSPLPPRSGPFKSS